MEQRSAWPLTEPGRVCIQHLPDQRVLNFFLRTNSKKIFLHAITEPQFFDSVVGLRFVVQHLH